MPDASVNFILAIVLIAFAFDFINGFHDSANSIATVVGTRVLSPQVAVLWAAFFNFVAAFTVGTAVAKTISKGLINPTVVDANVVLAGLLGAIYDHRLDKSGKVVKLPTERLYAVDGTPREKFVPAPLSSTR